MVYGYMHGIGEARYVGVDGMWTVGVKHGAQAWMGRIFLGTYPTAEEAAFVYMQHVASSGKSKRAGVPPARSGAPSGPRSPSPRLRGQRQDPRLGTTP